MYIDDAVNCPDLADFDVINAKTAQLKRCIEFFEQLLGIRRKERAK